MLQYKTDLPVPSPKEGELLVKNAFLGINYIDTYFRSGLYPAPKPEILGREASGIVASLGSGSNPLGFKTGDRVVWMHAGGYAEYTAIPADKTVKIPDGVKDEDAVGGFLTGMTALSLVKESYEVKKGDTVLLHAAAGGVGLLLCQLLRNIGAKTIATAGGPEKVELAKKNGADIVVDYKTEGGGKWLDKVKEVTNGTGVDVVFDSVGRDTWEGSLEAVKRKGTIAFFGNSSGAVPPFPIQRLAAKNCKILRPTLMNYTYTREEFEYYANELFKIMKAGDLKIKIHDIYPLEDVAEAHQVCSFINLFHSCHDVDGRNNAGLGKQKNVRKAFAEAVRDCTVITC